MTQIRVTVGFVWLWWCTYKAYARPRTRMSYGYSIRGIAVHIVPVVWARVRSRVTQVRCGIRGLRRVNYFIVVVIDERESVALGDLISTVGTLVLMAIKEAANNSEGGVLDPSAEYYGCNEG